MAIPKFDPKELTVVSETPGFMGRPPIQEYAFPVSQKEGVIAALKRQPYWQITGNETTYFAPKVNPDNVARAFVMDGSGYGFGQGGGADMFGIEWEYVPAVGGSMVRPGKPFIEDMNDWEDKVVFPDIGKWDWEESAAANKSYLSDTKYNCAWLQNGFFERLISFMEFEGAALAIIDEDQQDAVKAFLDKLSDLYIDILSQFLKYFPKIDGFFIHDDWGSQKETFFSPSVAKEMLVPYMKKVTDFIHGEGKFAELHSCGQALKQVPNFIAGGWDMWSGQLMNDTYKEYELYGDDILMGVTPPMFDIDTTPEEEQIKIAKDYCDFCCNPKKPSHLCQYGQALLTPTFRKALYQYSRENYSK